jgi:hypothetical protein
MDRRREVQKLLQKLNEIKQSISDITLGYRAKKVQYAILSCTTIYPEQR